MKGLLTLLERDDFADESVYAHSIEIKFGSEFCSVCDSKSDYLRALRVISGEEDGAKSFSRVCKNVLAVV